ncbi:hypothetical protein TVAG_057830 [Trichomonas vaginalis G3]|uniref:Uncharacterized protein n=1 Tax=Trichomonas vaginalis (strain ATCC PRA-98 / G3) TaxID=412133 RepID=A2FLD2_TRIV3|nr:SEC31-related protein family [Trichomonas vaginalis G3]EAX94282.1 hypothetical protein TVAG_057830 [Trichomonas vaginalis G3]KAI5524656.1 SEC31-related protein family [Trichomonas vaginalis G3]|eukprot:XP_001307212.1 hypothetical protein [Trichomonas vaginalis G3]
MKVWSSQESSLLAWCPAREQSRLFAQAVPAGSSINPVLSLKKFNFLSLNPSVETVSNYTATSPFTAIDWASRPNLEMGYIAAGHQNGAISLYNPVLDQQKPIGQITANNSVITNIKINPNQPAALLSTTADNSVNVWDVSDFTNAKKIDVNMTRGNSGDITGACWHQNKNCFSIFAVCDSTGLSTIWDIRVGRSTHTFADSQFKFPLSDIIFSPTNMAQLATASSDQRNSVVLIWDLRSLGAPLKRLHGHSNGVSKLEWPAADDRILLSAGRDGKVIAWDVESSGPLATVFEPNTSFTQVKWSPYIHGSVLASTSNSTHLFSFADPSIGAQTILKQPHFHYNRSGVDVAFDGRVFQYSDDKVSSFLHQEPITEINDFVEFVEALEQKDMKGFAARKAEASQSNPSENNIWKIIQKSMDSDTFKDAILADLGINKEDFVAKIKQSEPAKQAEKPKSPKKEAPAPTASSLFGNFTSQDDGLFSGTNSQEDLFSQSTEGGLFGAPPSSTKTGDELFGGAEFFTPFRVLPKQKDDETGRVIAQAVISSNLEAAVDCAFAAGRYADAMLVASAGPKELFDNTIQRYIKQTSSPLTRIVSHIIGHNLDNFVRYAKAKDWREIFAALCSFAEGDFEELCGMLGNRIVAELNDYNSALVIFVAAKNYEMVQRCLFKIYEQNSPNEANSASTVLIVLEKLCAMAGDKAPSVIAPLAQSFLQHIVQSGHKEEAIRFLSALPKDKILSDLKSAIVGEQSSYQQQPQQQRNVNSQQIPRHGTFIPQQNTYSNPPSVVSVQPQQQVSAPAASPSVFIPTATPQPTVNAPPPAAAPSVVVPAPSAQKPVYFPTSVANSVPSPQPRGPGVYYPSAAGATVPPRPAAIPHEPSAVPPPNSNDPRQLGRPTNYVPPPPPTVEQVKSHQQQFIPVANPVPESAPQSAVFTPVSTPQTAPAAPVLYGAATPQIAAPPPTSKPEIRAPPSISVVPPCVPQPAQPPSYPMGTAAPVMMGAQQPVAAAPPPAAQPTIITPPPAAAAAYRPQVAVAQPMPVPQQQMQPEPVVRKSPEATIDEVPDDSKALANGFVHFIQLAESRPEKSGQVKKAISDSKAKLGFVFAVFRDGDVPQELKDQLGSFFEALQKGDLDEADRVRKNAVVKFMGKCRNLVLSMGYIKNALT